MTDSLDDLYRDIILDHFRYPRGKKHLDKADIKAEGKNPTCGDELELELKIDHDKVEDVSVGCKGCAISVASGSILSELIKGKSLQEVKAIARLVKGMLTGEDIPNSANLGDLEALKGVKDFPVRIKCALLSWTALIDGIDAWEHKEKNKVSSTE
jgi:nitrogen fixation NifU-like protein